MDWENNGSIVALYHPRRDLWVDHFQFDANSGLIEPLSAQGRVTIFLLRLNDADRVMDRKLLIDEDRYPYGVIGQ